MHVIGLMSGTSLDALDAVAVEVRRAGSELTLELRAFAMLPLEPRLRERLRAVSAPGSGAADEICALNVLVGERCAEAAALAAEQAGLAPGEIDLIASHGQTICHLPGLATLQIGAPAVIAERAGCTVIADFRPRDIAAGGQGAPLVPFADRLLFGHLERDAAVQNIGGIANVTYLPRAGQPLAFDTGPGNMLIDEAVRLVTGGAALFDCDGTLAAQGSIQADLLGAWLEHPFFSAPPPKSTGRELWGVQAAAGYVGAVLERGGAPADAIATLTAFTARSIALAYERFLGPVAELIVSGGGARNPALLAMLRDSLPACQVVCAERHGLDSDAREALVFALLGYWALHGWPCSAPWATGARHPAVLGALTPGRNYRRLLAGVLESEAPPRRVRLIGRAAAPARGGTE